MKKFFAIILAVALVLSLTIAANAAGGTITIKGASNGAQYTLYKIFDVSGELYSIPSGKETVYQATTNFGANFDTNVAEGKTYVSMKSGADVVAWASANKASFVKIGDTQTAASEGATVTFAPTEDGYYYIDSTSSPSKAIIYRVTDNITIQEKNGEPSWGDGGKTADQPSYQFGETVSYTLSYNNALNYSAGEAVTAYIVEDTLPAGITFNSGSFSVKINGTSVNVAPTVSGQQITASIPWTPLAVSAVPATIEVQYTATVSGTAAVNTPLENTAKIYPITAGDPDGPDDKPERKNQIITGKIVIDKENAEHTKLSGAKFILKSSDNKFYKLDSGVVTWVDNADDADVKVTVNGAAEFTGLKAGAYTLVETEAPAGYTLPANPNTAVTLTATTTTDTNGNTIITTTSVMSSTQTILNTKADAMPETGGIGTAIFYILGGALFAGALIVLIAKKRVGAKG